MAFTQAVLKDEIYMYQPAIFENDPENLVCKLKKSLYGLKQSARKWGNFLREIFVKCKFSSIFSDPCVYILIKNESWCMCSTHVDDILFI